MYMPSKIMALLSLCKRILRGMAEWGRGFAYKLLIYSYPFICITDTRGCSGGSTNRQSLVTNNGAAVLLVVVMMMAIMVCACGGDFSA